MEALDDVCHFMWNPDVIFHNKARYTNGHLLDQREKDVHDS